MNLHPVAIARGGTVPLAGHLYVPRPIDQTFRRAVLARGKWINIFGCRTMGKSSLYARHLPFLRRSKLVAGCIDLGTGRRGTNSPMEWLEDFASSVSFALKLDDDIVYEFLKRTRLEISLGNRIMQLFDLVVRKCKAERLFLAIDEFDLVADLPFRDEILSAFRQLHAENAIGSRINKLTFAFVGLRALSRLGDEWAANTSPFNAAIEVLDFDNSKATVDALSRAFPSDTIPEPGALERLLLYTGGQPLITMELLDCLRESGGRTIADLDNLAADRLARSKSHPDEYFAQFQKIEGYIRTGGDYAYAALTAYEKLLRNTQPQHDASTELLMLAGLVKGSQEILEPKGLLFRQRFDLAWVGRMQKRVATETRQFRGRAATHKRARICVINTGGTIGMVERGNKVVAPRDSDEFKGYFTALNSLVEDVEFINLFPPRDSINVFPEQWVIIAKYIYSRRHDRFNGFVICHGTDTMAYTASAVAFALGPHLRFPVVFTGAQTTPDVPYGDAHVNLYRACEVAKMSIPEVVICFGNFVFRAVRAQKKDDRRFEGFESPTYPAIAEITGEINVRSELIRPLPRRERDINLKAEFESSILIVPQYPGLEPSFFDHLLPEEEQSPLCKGVIVQTLGAGNVANEDPYSFIPFVGRAYARGIPVIVTSQYPPDPGSHTKYTPAEAPIRAGAIHAGNMTQAAAVTKFRWILAQVSRRSSWAHKPPEEKKAIVTRLMVNKALIGEF